MSYSNTILADSPYLYWHMDAASGTSEADASGNARTGTYNTSGVTLNIAGAVGDADNAASFDGVAGYCKSSTAVFTSSAASLECWVKLLGPAPSSSNEWILGCVNGLSNATFDKYLWIDTSGKINWSVFSGTTKTVTGPQLGLGWHHIVGTISSTTLTLYVDGVSVGSLACSGSFTNYTVPNLFVGGRSSTISYGYATVDEVAVYSSVLNSTTVSSHYAAAPARRTTTANTTPQDLVWSKVGTPRNFINSFDGTFPITARNAFASDVTLVTDALVFSGTTSIVSGSGSTTFSGASAGNEVLRFRNQALAPYVYAAANVSSTSNGSAVVGWALDANNYCRAHVVSGQIQIDCAFHSTTATSGNLGAAPSTPYKLLCLLCYPEIWVYTDTGSGYSVVGSLTFPTTSQDLRSLSEFQGGWHPMFGADRSAGGSVAFSWFEAGYAGAIGVRDFKPLTDLTGQPWIANGRFYLMATCANGGDFETNNACVLSFDATTPDPSTARLETLIFFNISSTDPTNAAATKDKCTALYGGQILRDTANNQWIINTNSWGYVDSGIKLWEAKTSSDLLTQGGVFAVDARQLVVSATGNIYDNSQRFESGTEKMVCALGAGAGAGLYTGPDSDHYTLSVQDLTHPTEGLNWVRIGQQWWATGGGAIGPHLWDASLTYQSSMAINMNLTGTNASFSSYGSHFPIIALYNTMTGQTTYYAIMFSDDKVGSANATKGKLVLMVASVVVSGSEFSTSTTPPLRMLLGVGQ